MIRVDCEQGSPAWLQARIGLPTASNFDRIISASGNELKGSNRYLAHLVAEWFLGQSLDEYKSPFMERGTQMEARAVAAYEFKYDIPNEGCRKVGLVLRDDRRCGASPDRLVGDRGLLEIKVPSAEVHMAYLLGEPTSDYFVQVQGQLWVCEREWVDLLSFNGAMPDVEHRYQRDEEFIGRLAKAVERFSDRLDAAKAKLADRKAEYDAARAAELEAMAGDLPAMLS